MDWKLEVVVVPVSDVDRAKHFYAEQVGFVVDVDHSPNEAFRVVQMTPRGSGCTDSVTSSGRRMVKRWVMREKTASSGFSFTVCGPSPG